MRSKLVIMIVWLLVLFSLVLVGKTGIYFTSKPYDILTPSALATLEGGWCTQQEQHCVPGGVSCPPPPTVGCGPWPECFSRGEKGDNCVQSQRCGTSTGTVCGTPDTCEWEYCWDCWDLCGACNTISYDCGGDLDEGICHLTSGGCDGCKDASPTDCPGERYYDLCSDS